MMRFLHALWLLLLCGGLLAPHAWAQSDDSAGAAGQEVVLWTFDAPQLSSQGMADVRAALKSALPRENARHLLGEDALSDYIGTKTMPLPPCLAGLEACVSPRALAFDALGLTLVIHVEIDQQSDGWHAAARWVDRRGQLVGESAVEASSARDLAFALAGDIFDATGAVLVQSDPPGALVEIDGDAVGTTPLKYRLALGEHRYRLTLDAYHPIEGEFSLTGDAPADIEHHFEPLPGVLTLSGAPDGAEIFVDNERLGVAAEPLELAAGRYEIEVRADGYDSYRETLEFGAGQQVQRRLTMNQTHPLLRDVPSEAIIANRYVGRLSYEHGFQHTTFFDARARVDGAHYSFLSFDDHAGSANPIDRDIRHWVDPNGLRLDLSYHWENFGLVLLSASYISTSLKLDALLTSSDQAQPVPVELLHLSRLQLRPFQLQYRFFYKNLAPFAEIGTGINLQWLKTDGPDLREPITLSHAEAFGTVGLGTHYFFTPHIFGTFRYGAQFILSDGAGIEHLLNLGVGLALPNFFGVEAEPPEKL